ncbi:MAG: cyclophilin-like domain-containing protein [Olpidium bornovanus]|uniref:Peptidyl-prolyl cis-trans isomerase n=1 Tax=Olpidium bornovanus TaxID=278681 RepID=A0A8H7ZRZ0_9FUNG|nr:MAG: cyclophilin-like domain-containing protein [Olpidium bornovanus]
MRLTQPQQRGIPTGGVQRARKTLELDIIQKPKKKKSSARPNSSTRKSPHLPITSPLPSLPFRVRGTTASMDVSNEEPQVVLETSMGPVAFELYWDEAPKACKNFTQLAKQGYYNNVRFHRIISDFMIQFEDECVSTLKHTGAGILSMANSGPGTNGSQVHLAPCAGVAFSLGRRRVGHFMYPRFSFAFQFFITLAPTPWLDNKHTIFGRVASGMKVVQRMGMVATDRQDRYGVGNSFIFLMTFFGAAFASLIHALLHRPKEDVKILRATLSYD